MQPMNSVGTWDRGNKDSMVPSTEYGIEMPVREREKGGQGVGSLYDTVRHAAIFPKGGYEQVAEMVDNSADSLGHTGEFLDLPEYMRPINGGWC